MCYKSKKSTSRNYWLTGIKQIENVGPEKTGFYGVIRSDLHVQFATAGLFDSTDCSGKISRIWNKYDGLVAKY
jgi:hypothetical protein